MNKIAFLYGAETRRLKKIVHKTRDKDLCRRANAVLLVLKGETKSQVARVLQAGRSSVNRWITWYDAAGIDGLKTKGVGRPASQPKGFICGVLKLLVNHIPRTLGYQRSRWSSELFALLLHKLYRIVIHSSTLRRWLPQVGIVWRRAAPTLYIQDPDKEAKLAAMREALENCSVDHPVFYQDEVDIHLNPKIGADWGFKGKQRKVATPGQNKKHYLAGALHSQTGQISYVGGERKTSDLFIALLEQLKGQYRRAKSITLIVDNYIIHKSKKTQKWLNENPKFKLLFLPVYSPWHNKIEKLWHALHETITRNHQCKNMDDLLEQVYHFMDTAAPFPGGKHGLKRVYHN
ncbi:MULTISPECIES: IS630 family transposase [unclassified Arsukibacterium]|uniref:IS630 family transposase n=1 Tax=unclassified Arsukibacterium TaxID=2635278 RepID=UPI000C35FBE5|nr:MULTISPECIES: IS630 family transposase [unclassified Arsukibacterium]MAB17876.1 IS630 family transposase [Roseobacter sp.]MBM33366.1 IS630 family transposase [Rheinheimera sp.]|tara:strand:+ start:264 stop:1304 length:1041 start_codon:yes stop_codon:yes gene_type:complete